MHDDLPRSQDEALRKGAFLYFTGRVCKHGHVAPRYASFGG